MKYFIDFEAAQFSETIISVGCIREDGEGFYSLVRTPDNEQLTPYIIELTGITNEMVQDALSSDEVFEEFYDWAFTTDDNPDFFVWGDSDVNFVRNTFRKTNSRKARMALGYMSGSITDYAKTFCRKTKIKSGIALIKAYNGLINAEKQQSHNALDDAIMLSEVYKVANNMPNNELREKITLVMPVTNNSSPISVVKWSDLSLPAGTICIINKQKELLHSFADMENAIEWILNTKISEKQRNEVKRDTIRKHIVTAYSRNTKYFSHTWRIVTK